MFSLLTAGWPSFSDVAEKGNVARIEDNSYGMVRTEVVCAKVREKTFIHLEHV